MNKSIIDSRFYVLYQMGGVLRTGDGERIDDDEAADP